MTAGSAAGVVIGLDVGTTAVKAVAFATTSGWRHLAVRDYSALGTTPDPACHDPAVVLRSVAGALTECAHAVGSGEVVGVSVAAAMHGLVALDVAYRPLTPILTWADARAADQARQLHAAGQAGDIHARTGVPVHPMTPLVKLLWFAQNRPELLTGARWWAGLKDYVLWWLTGTLVTEISSASGTGLVDLGSRSWSATATELCGIRVAQLPDIAGTTDRLTLGPSAASQTGLPAGTPVVTGAADGPLSNVGAGALAPGVAGLSLGTSGAVRLTVHSPVVDPDGALFCYALTDSLWVVGGAVSNGAAVARWAARALLPSPTPGGGGVGGGGVGGGEQGALEQAALELAATVPPGSDGLALLPYLLPERSPLADPDLAGAFVGLRSSHTRAHLLRAAVEGVALQLRLVVDRLDRLDGVGPVTSIRGVGGAFRSVLWTEVVAGMVGRPFRVSAVTEGTALGAAALGLVALGYQRDLEAAFRSLAGDPGDGPAVTVDPNADQVYAELRASVPVLVDALHRAAGSGPWT